MRAGPLLLSVSLLLAACGDDGKVAPGGTPAAQPPSRGGMPSSWESSPEVLQERASQTSWARTRLGDTAVWEIRMTGNPRVTRLTWKASRIEDGYVHFDVDAVTLDAEGRTLTTAQSREERHPVGVEAPMPTGVEKPFEAAEVAGQRIRQVRQAGPRPEGVIIAVSDEVPLGGLVRRRENGVDHVLVSFTRTP